MTFIPYTTPDHQNNYLQILTLITQFSELEVFAEITFLVAMVTNTYIFIKFTKRILFNTAY